MLKVFDAFVSIKKSTDELKKRMFHSCVTKTVYMIEIDKQPYVLKIQQKFKPIADQLINEEKIYNYLSKQSK